jgi:type 1 glutamine amidotransferase
MKLELESIMKNLYRFALLVAVLSIATSQAAEKRILVYIRNGKGVVHENIQNSVDAIRRVGAENGLTVDVSDNPEVFTDANLKRYRALVFSNTNNQVFENDPQRDAFKRYIQSGGGFAGIHSASATERNWPYFWAVVGGKLVRHAKMQKFVVRVKVSNHLATRNLPATFEWTDECYYLDHLNPDIQTLLVTDPAQLDDPQKATYPGDRFGDSLPLAWYHTFDGGREFYTSLGHRKEDYENPILYKLILGGILWAVQAP